ncbi:MAG: hypothetical protein K6A92_04620 [Lachnospiraceae bacterium]|nr:hypothetical protein [Lachnospiraceae bacterium]
MTDKQVQKHKYKPILVGVISLLLLAGIMIVVLSALRVQKQKAEEEAARKKHEEYMALLENPPEPIRVSESTGESDIALSTITVHEHTPYEDALSDADDENRSSADTEESSSIVIHDYDETGSDYFDRYQDPADDEYDYLWANDFELNEFAGLCAVHDAKGYVYIYDQVKPTYKDLCKAIDKNKQIDPKYIPYIKAYLKDWLALYPESDFSNFLYNLKGLQVREVSTSDMKFVALSADALACYRQKDNTIYINEAIDLSDRAKDDYIILGHELWHAARLGRHQSDKLSISVGFYAGSELGYYADEALDTYFMYQVQGYGERSQFYLLSSNYFRIIMEAIGDHYSGSDYMNHSVNYLALQMDTFMEDTPYAGNALKTLHLLDGEMDLHYEKNTDVTKEDLQYLFDYLMTMYCKTQIDPGTSATEAEDVFTSFMEEVTYRLEGLRTPYEEITPEAFRPAWERYCEDLGIRS